MSQEDIPSYQLPRDCDESHHTFSQHSNLEENANTNYNSISSISSSSEWSIDCSIQDSAPPSSQFTQFSQQSHYGPLQSTQAEEAQNLSQQIDHSNQFNNDGYGHSSDTITHYHVQPCQFWPDSQDLSFWGLSDSGNKYSDVSF